MAPGRVAGVLVAVLALTSLHEAGAVTINSVSPTAGSRKGGTRVKIFGSDIPKDFSMDFDVVSVNFVSSTQSYPCDVERTSVNDKQIECYTSAMPLGKYTPEVTVCTSANSRDCTTFRCDDPEVCTFETTNWRTPFIQTITPNTGYPGE
ncbi:fibrocystin-L-like [Branchiostoma floridae]|uniref:Fibrocystin-L-like n=1 Tax=Branchiostoma floridae TaxID=7739 RepID=A0A9J7MXY8_BRAFL|nr:fibrocystin-L-like [Branchiostoma floridae]